MSMKEFDDFIVSNNESKKFSNKVKAIYMPYFLIFFERQGMDFKKYLGHINRLIMVQKRVR